MITYVVSTLPQKFLQYKRQLSFLSVFLFLFIFANIQSALSAHENRLDLLDAVVFDSIASVQGINLVWQIDPAGLDASDGRVELAGFEQTGRPGERIQPFQSHLVVLPDGATPKIEIISLESEPIKLDLTLPLAPVPAGVERTADGEIVGPAFAPADDSVSALPNRPIVEFEEVGVMGGVRLGRVSFYPVVVNDDRHPTEIISELKVFLDFGQSVNLSPVNRERADLPSGISAALLDQVVNPDHLLGSNVAERQPQAGMNAPSPNLILEVQEAGLYALSYESLTAVDGSLSAVDPRKIQLQKEGAAVSMLWEGDSDGRFEAGERFLFYAAHEANRWSTSEFFTLSVGSENGERISDLNYASGSLANRLQKITKHYEEDNGYTPNCVCGQLPAGHDGDRWIWDEFRSPGNPSGTYPLNLDMGEIDTSENASLTIWMIGFTDLSIDDDHAVNVSIDGQHLDQIIWDGKTSVEHTVTFPAAILSSESELELEINEVAGRIDGVWLDAFELSTIRKNITVGAEDTLKFYGESEAGQYQVDLAEKGWVFDVTDPQHPQSIPDAAFSGNSVLIKDVEGGGRAYVAASETALKQPLLRKAKALSGIAADYWMIGPAGFEAGLTELIALREAQGWTVEFISVEEIYDSYGHGYPSPLSIRDAIQDGYESADVRPEAILLVGDGTYDPKNNQGNSKPTHVPVFFANVDRDIGEVPADNRYVAVDGDDVLPDLMIGRLPVNDLVELGDVVKKLTDYPRQNFSWRQNIAFVGDDNDKGGNYTFFIDEQADRLVGSSYQSQSVQFSGEDSGLSQVQSSVTNLFNNGSNHIVYFGHSTVHQWGDENFIHISQIGQLNNRSKLPIVLQMTCFTGSFHMTGLDGFDEALLRDSSGGAAAVWGATGLSVSVGHRALTIGYTDALLAGNGPTLGQATISGKLNLITNRPNNIDLADTYTLFGDPALILEEPGSGSNDPSGVFLPLVKR